MKKYVFTLICATGILTLSGCASLTKEFTATGDHKFEPREKGCDINVYMTNPKKEFYEVGVIDISAGCAPFGCPAKKLKTASSVKNLVRDDVCKAGGNAILLWEANGDGLYKKATVIKTVE